MRNILIAALAVSSIPGLDNADACGFVPPHVMLLSSHSGHVHGTAWGTRTFAVLGEAVPADVRWQPLVPGTYDSSQIANERLLDKPRVLTLVGPAGTRVVSTAQQAVLSPAWGFRTPSTVLEVDTGAKSSERFAVALDGSHPKATWTALETVQTSSADVAWVAAHGVKPRDAAHVIVHRVPGADADAITVMADDSVEMTTLVRRGDQLVERLDGSAFGSLREHGQSYVIAVHDSAIAMAWI